MRPIPFTYMKPWTPATRAKFWWTADLGVSFSGSDVTAWQDQVSGKVMSQGTAIRRPSYRTLPALNNQNVITFSDDWLQGTPISFASEGFSFSYFVVFDDNDTGQNSIIAQSSDGALAGRMAMGHITSTTNLQCFNPLFTTTQAQTLLAATPTGSHYVAWDYNAVGNVRGWGDNFTTPTVNQTGGAVNRDLIQTTSLLFGTYNGASGTAVNQTWNYSGSIAEVGFFVGTLSNNDLLNLENYITNKYNL